MQDMIPLSAPKEKIPSMATWTTNATEAIDPNPNPNPNPKLVNLTLS